MAEKRRNEEDVKKRREEEVKRSREVMPRSCKLSKVTSSTTSEEEESNGGRACAPISRKFLNLFAKNDSQNSATGVYFQTFFTHINTCHCQKICCVSQNSKKETPEDK